MVHAHKEIYLETATGGKWHHLDALHFRFEKEAQLKGLMQEVLEDPIFQITVKWPRSTELTELDYIFHGHTIEERLFVGNRLLARFRLRWDDLFEDSFDKTFGCWPWDHIDTFVDPESYNKLRREYKVKDCRLFLWVQ